MSLTLAVATAPAHLEKLTQFVKSQYGSLLKKLVVGTKPEDFAELKKSKEKFALMIYTATARDVLKDLSDDYESAPHDRRIQYIYSITAGVDAYRMNSIVSQLEGLTFTNGQGCYCDVLAEWCLYMMMYFNRDIWRLFTAKRASKWDPYYVHSLHGQKLVVVGYGDIGQRCAKAARHFDMEVYGIRRTVTKETDENGVHVRTNEALDELLPKADYVIGVLPGTKETTHMFDKNFFVKMNPHAIFMNIGRGITQVDNDLADAVNKGVIRGAAIDVAEQEPLPSTSPLWALPDDKLLISPHNADMTEDIVFRSVTRSVGIAEEFLKKGTISAYKVNVRREY